jgi:hypothetical protein
MKKHSSTLSTWPFGRVFFHVAVHATVSLPLKSTQLVHAVWDSSGAMQTAIAAPIGYLLLDV